MRGMGQSENGAYCGLVAESLAAYLDRSLPAPVERQIASHLEACPDCRRRLTAMTALVRDLRCLGDIEAGPEMSWAIKRLIRREARRENARALIRPLPFLASAAAAAAVFVLLGLTSRPGLLPGSTPAPVPRMLQAEESPLWERRYALPAQVDELRSGTFAERQRAGSDSTATREPTRLHGIRAVSF